MSLAAVYAELQGVLKEKKKEKEEKYCFFKVYSQFDEGGYREVQNSLNIGSSWCLCRGLVSLILMPLIYYL